MKKKMCRWIFKKELNEAYTELNNSYCREVRRVEAAMEHNEKNFFSTSNSRNNWVRRKW